MHRVIARITGALLLLSLFGLAAARASSGVPDTLEQRLRACAACHGDQGQGLNLKNEYVPRLAGKPAGYLFNQLQNFRDKRRRSAIMNYMVAYLSDDYLREIAAHYAALQPPYPPPATRAAAEVLAHGERLVRHGDTARRLPACSACHGEALTGMAPSIPGLLGLYPPYVNAQLGAWKGDTRQAMAPDCMHTVAQQLTPADIAAVTAWLVAQPVPANPKPLAAGSLKLPLECGGVTPTAGSR